MKRTLPDNFNSALSHSIEEAAALLPQLSTSKFVGSVDIDVVLALTDKQRKETVRGSVVLSHQLGEQKRVIVIADEANAKIAREAGADEAGLEDLIAKIEAGSVTYDIVIATPTVMAKLAKLGKILGPKGLMPNPANETVTADLDRVVKMYKAGKLNFKMTDQGVIRGKVAKVNMEPAQIAANISDYLKAIMQAARKLNQQPFKKITVSPTMGAAVKIDVTKAVASI